MAALVLCPWCPGFDPKDPRLAGLSSLMCVGCAAKLLTGITRAEQGRRAA